jgi:hypothetical protein
MPNNGKPRFSKNIFQNQPNEAGAETLDASVGKIKRAENPRAGVRARLQRAKQVSARNKKTRPAGSFSERLANRNDSQYKGR